MKTSLYRSMLRIRGPTTQLTGNLGRDSPEHRTSVEQGKLPATMSKSERGLFKQKDDFPDMIQRNILVEGEDEPRSLLGTSLSKQASRLEMLHQRLALTSAELIETVGETGKVLNLLNPPQR